jgi:hypothetical protein
MNITTIVINYYILRIIGGEREGAGGRNDPNNVYTYEYMNKEKKKETDEKS